MTLLIPVLGETPAPTNTPTPLLGSTPVLIVAQDHICTRFIIDLFRISWASRDIELIKTHTPQSKRFGN
jgi:hypothetical protein